VTEQMTEMYIITHRNSYFINTLKRIVFIFQPLRRHQLTIIPFVIRVPVMFPE